MPRGPSRCPRLAGQSQGSDRALLQLAALPLGQPAPDAEPFVLAQRILEALAAHLATEAHPLRLTSGTTLFGKERLGIGLSAQGALLPTQRTFVAFFELQSNQLMHGIPPRPGVATRNYIEEITLVLFP